MMGNPNVSQLAIRSSYYNQLMSAHVIGNPVPTPEEMGRILGLSSERVAAVRSIMSTPSSRKSSRSKNRTASSSNMKRDRSRTSSKDRGRR
jgi:3-polyprenyl-4-hydroxybenzoate decarboxylase